MNINTVRDYSKLQGVHHPADLSNHILRDINVRYITIENSSNRSIGVAITPYRDGPNPKIMFFVVPGEVKHLAVNSRGGPDQFIRCLDPESGLPVSSAKALISNANQFVLRDGVNGWFVETFYRPSYCAAK